MTHSLPERFLPAGAVTWARLSDQVPSFATAVRKPRGAKAAGLRYERKATEMLEQYFSWRFVPGPWVLFGSESKGTRWCQPDGLLILPEEGRIVVVEIKHSHMALAWWQLFHLYIPVVKALFGPAWAYSGCEVVKYYDAATKAPQAAKLRKRIERTEPDEFGVHIYNPQHGEARS